MLRRLRASGLALVCLVALTLPGRLARADDDVPLFAPRLEYGSDAQFSPAQVLLNGSFDILRNMSYQHRPLDVDYRNGFANVWDNVAHPIDSIRRIGPGDFVAHEIVPYRGLDKNYGQFVPNWFMHTLGEGMLFRKLEGWYLDRDVPFARAAAIGTVLAMQWTNEAVENGSFRGKGADSIADILLFNLAGYALFWNDQTARIFHDQVRTLYWPGQATLTPDGRLINHGENFAFQVDVGLPDLRLFGYFGVEGLFGATMPLGDAEDHLSLGAGYRMFELTAQERNGVRTMLPGTAGAWEAGAFWDRKGSLLASVIASLPPTPAVHVNLYPGVLSLHGLTVGLFLKVSAVEGIESGVLFGNVPLGIGGWRGEPRQLAHFH